MDTDVASTVVLCVIHLDIECLIEVCMRAWSVVLFYTFAYIVNLALASLVINCLYFTIDDLKDVCN